MGLQFLSDYVDEFFMIFYSCGGNDYSVRGNVFGLEFLDN